MNRTYGGVHAALALRADACRLERAVPDGDVPHVENGNAGHGRRLGVLAQAREFGHLDLACDGPLILIHDTPSAARRGDIPFPA